MSDVAKLVHYRQQGVQICKDLEKSFGDCTLTDQVNQRLVLKLSQSKPISALFAQL